MNYFVDADFNKLWKPVTSEYKRFTLPFPTDEELTAHEKRLGVKLPPHTLNLSKPRKMAAYSSVTEFPFVMKPAM